MDTGEHLPPERRELTDEERRVPGTLEELADLEARYRPFEPLGKWGALRLDRGRWDRYAAALVAARSRATTETAAALQDRLLRAAALDSGALARMYPPNPELTFGVLATVEGIDGDPLDPLGEAMRLFVECNRRALILASEVAADGRAVDPNLMAVLYDVITEAQGTFTAAWPDGRSLELVLPRHQYKPATNFGTNWSGRIVPFCPAGRVAEEMDRLAAELASPGFAASHPAVQIAYAHYALSVVHPFADGNGRLARTIASIFAMRAVGVPFLVFADQWPSYRRAEIGADDGALQQYLDRFFAFLVGTMELAANLLAADPRPRVATLNSIGTTTGALDDAAVTLVHDALWIELHDLLPTPQHNVRIAVGELREPPALEDPAHRVIVDPRTGRSGVRVSISAGDGRAMDWVFVPLVSTDPQDIMPVAILEMTTDTLFEVTLDDAHPFALEGTLTRLRAWVSRLLSGGLDRVSA